MPAGETPVASVVELFRSFQGEGLRAGALQAFVRFAGCDRRCRYCDTPDARDPGPRKTRVELGGSKRWTRDNPWTPRDLADAVAQLGRIPVCLTGGEPLLRAEFLEAFLPLLEPGTPVHLETHGLLAEAFARVAPRVSSVAACAKLPSATGETVDWDAFSAFLEAAKSRGLFVKAVVTSGTDPAELAEAFRRTALAGRSIPFVIQPVTPRNGAEAPDFRTLEEFCREGLERLDDVRVIPQIHALMRWK
ncbi:MAG: 7-carboxy-7-deazaguanine synthase QueE [Planctomycetes bacterium]|jgi:organic radical activating enzyme|nr:7-carboxy-7-deazaguanine synthase QueE [Planctomycetota bacterium]